MPLFLFPALPILLVGLLALGIMASNSYYSRAHVSGARAFLNFLLQNSPVGVLFTYATQLFTRIISRWMAEAVGAVDAAIGTGFHYLSREAEMAANTLLDISTFALTVAQAVTGNVTWHEVAVQLRELRHTIRAAEHRAEVATERVIAQEKATARSIAQGVYPRIRAIEHEIARPIAHEIKTARELAREAEHEAIRAFKVARHALRRTSTRALTLALPAVIARLGWDWIKCKEAQNVYNKRGCNMWNEIDALLGAAVLIAGTMSLIELARAEQAVVGEAAQIVRGFWEL